MMQFLKEKTFWKRAFFLFLLSPLLVLGLLNILGPQMEMEDNELLEDLISAGLDKDHLHISYVESAEGKLRFMHYAEDSIKPLLLMIHGSPGDLSGFELYFKDSILRSKFQLVAFDRPGFGKSTRPASPSLDEQMTALQEVLDQTAYSDLYLLGHSYGGSIVWTSFLHSVKGLKHSLVIAGSVDPELEPREWWRPLLDQPLVSWTLPRMLNSSNHEIKGLYEELLVLHSIDPIGKGAMTVFQGDVDRLVPPGNAHYLKEKVKDSDIIWFKGEGHFILWSKQREIADYIIGLL